MSHTKELVEPVDHIDVLGALASNMNIKPEPVYEKMDDDFYLYWGDVTSFYQKVYDGHEYEIYMNNDGEEYLMRKCRGTKLYNPLLNVSKLTKENYSNEIRKYVNLHFTLADSKQSVIDRITKVVEKFLYEG